MKKLPVVLLLASLLLNLTACGGEGAAVTGTGDEVGDEALEVISAREEEEENMGWWTPQPREADFSKLTIIPDAASGESLLIPDIWVTEHGAYYINTIQPGMDIAYSSGGRGGGVSVGSHVDEWRQITLIHIIDSATGKDMVLCNRVTCPHDSEDCGAFLPDDPADPDEFNQWGFTSYRGWGGGNCLFVDGEYIYALNSGNTFYRLGLDGGGRTEHMRIPDKYDFSWGQNWLMNGKLYMMTNIMIPNEEWGYNSVPALIEIDYANKTVNEIWAGDLNFHANVLGLWSGQLYLIETLYPEWGQSQEDMLNYYNNQEINIFSYNPATGQRTDIFSDTGYGFTGNTWNIPDSGEIIFHSRRDETLSRLNVKTGEITLLAENAHGFIFINEERDGRISMIRYNNDDWMTNHQLIDISYLFCDINTGEFGEITLRTRQNAGDNEFMYIQFEEDGYYYVEAEREVEEHTDYGGYSWFEYKRTLLGRIPIDDYWASNADAIEELDWYDQNEWWEFLSEVHGWGTGGFARG
ncbi:MAG: hypothetical protein FWE74_08405 [Oscillospiraceae bacterium]|nr:hypothetical protein [Oscillospiraceae bacterium]